MYKITLYDYNCSPLCDGTTSFFIDSLEDFEKHWMAHACVDDDTKDRYVRSKSGENVTDYCTDDPKYNIVQKDDSAVVLFEREYSYSDKTFALFNAYGCESNVYAKHAEIKLRYIKFNKCYYLIGQYQLLGVCAKEQRIDLYGCETGWRACNVWGNPILLSEYTNKEPWIDQDGKRRLDYPKEQFVDDKIETYCWVTVGEFGTEEDLDMNMLGELSNDFFVILMRDIPGEAG